MLVIVNESKVGRLVTGVCRRLEIVLCVLLRTMVRGTDTS
jgi:hypothetical protein